MEQAATEISRSFYADYGALAILVLINTGVGVAMYRYFTAEIRHCREHREKSEAGWQQRYDALVDRMVSQVAAQATTLERMADRIREK
jgi:5,10-methylenetetrahydrofolate reductase